MLSATLTVRHVSTVSCFRICYMSMETSGVLVERSITDLVNKTGEIHFARHPKYSCSLGKHEVALRLPPWQVGGQT